MLQSTIKLAGMLCALACLFTISIPGLAQERQRPVEGAYDITASGDQVGTVKFVMTLKLSGDRWRGEFKNAPLPLNIESVVIDDNDNVTINATSDGTAVTIKGKYVDGKIVGKWTAGGSSGDWSGTKQSGLATGEVKAVIAPPSAGASTASSTATSAAAVEGTYDAQITADGQGSLNFILVVKRDGEKLMTEVKEGGDINVVGLMLNGDEVTLNATYQGNPFALPGKRMGQDMGGKWEAGGFSGTWTAKKRAN